MNAKEILELAAMIFIGLIIISIMFDIVVLIIYFIVRKIDNVNRNKKIRKKLKNKIDF